MGALAYSALFLALSLVTRRPVLLGLVYVLIWEGLLGNVVSGTRVLSIQQYVVTIADRIAPTDLLAGQVSVPVSLGDGRRVRGRLHVLGRRPAALVQRGRRNQLRSGRRNRLRSGRLSPSS